MSIQFSVAFAPGITIKTGISPTGTSVISTNGLINIANYSSINVNIKDLLDIRLQGALDISTYTDLSATKVNPYAFTFQSISSINMPNVQEIKEYAFFNVWTPTTTTTTFTFPKCTTINAYSFGRTTTQGTRWLNIELPICTRIPDYGCYGNTYLKSVSMPQCTYVGSCAFNGCTALESPISLSNCSYIGSQAFYNCIKIPSISLPNCTAIAYMGFYACSSIGTIYLPNCSSVGTYAFNGCNQLTSLDLPKCSYWADYMCWNDYALTTVSVGSACTYIANYVFSNCYNLLSVYMNVTSVPTLINNAFTNTPISNYTTSTGGVYGKIYVPSSLYTAFTTANTWSNYSARMVSM